MSSIPRFPSLFVKVIEEQWIGSLSPYPSIPDPSLPNSDQSKHPPVFRSFFSGTAISDGFYTIPATTQVNIPSDSSILITDWDLHYTTRLSITIKKAEIHSDSPKSTSREVEIEKNPLIANMLRRFKFMKLQKAFYENDSECSEPSQNFLMNLDKMNQELENEEVDEREKGVTEKILEIVREEKPSSRINIAVSYNMGLEVFPTYALEYLKHKYNVV